MASAQGAEVSSSISAQSYTLQSPYGSPTVRRRRFTETLGAHLYDLQGDAEPGGPRLSFVARLRLDADLGQQGAERDPTSLDRYVPGLRETPLDLMVGYLDARNYAGGWLGGRLGRQYVTDMLGWWSFDGALLSITTPVFVRLEAYGGYEQRGGLPMMSSSRFTADGVYRGRREGLEASQWPSYLEESKLAPAFGMALETTDPHWVHARLSYRKVLNRDTVSVSPFVDESGLPETVDETRVSTERVGGSVWLTESDLGTVAGSAVYDLLSQLFSQHAASLSWYATRRITLTVEYDYFLPTFDGDSIFNWFTHQGMTSYQLRGAFELSRRLAFTAGSGLRQFRTEGDPALYQEQALSFDSEPPARDQTGIKTDVLGTLGSHYSWSQGSVGLIGRGEAGATGRRVGADATTTRQFYGGLYDTLVILSLYDWRDDLRSGRDATSFGYVLGGGVTPFSRTRMGIEWEHSMNRLVGQRFRLLGTLTVGGLR